MLKKRKHDNGLHLGHYKNKKHRGAKGKKFEVKK